MGLGSAFPCLSSIVQGKAAAERIVYTITRTPLIDSASDHGTKLATARGEIELKVPTLRDAAHSRHRSAISGDQSWSSKSTHVSQTPPVHL